MQVTLTDLVNECKSKKKTSHLEYSSLGMQEYFCHLYPNQAKVVFKVRSPTLDLKTNLTYK